MYGTGKIILVVFSGLFLCITWMQNSRVNKKFVPITGA
jgi:hypothetical protein